MIDRVGINLTCGVEDERIREGISASSSQGGIGNRQCWSSESCEVSSGVGDLTLGISETYFAVERS